MPLGWCFYPNSLELLVHRFNSELSQWKCDCNTTPTDETLILSAALFSNNSYSVFTDRVLLKKEQEKLCIKLEGVLISQYTESSFCCRTQTSYGSNILFLNAAAS